MKLINLEMLQYFYGKLIPMFEEKVDKKPGYDLSENDLTNALKENYDEAYTHSQETHAPMDAEKNVVVGINVNGTAMSVNGDRTVDISVPTELSQLTEDDTHKLATAAQLEQIATNADDIATLKDEGDGSIKAMIDAAINAFATELTDDGTVNTYKEALDWIATHASDYTTLLGDVANKVDKVAGKGLSTNDLTGTLKNNYDAAYTHSQVKTGNPHNVTKSDLGLANVENKSSATIRGELTAADVTKALNFTPIDSADVEVVSTTDIDGIFTKA